MVDEFMAGMRVKKIFPPEKNRAPEKTSIVKITKKGLIRLEGEIDGHTLLRANGHHFSEWFYIVPDYDTRLAELNARKEEGIYK